MGWAVSEVPAVAFMQPVTDLWDWIYNVKQVLSADLFARFVCCCWTIWNNRNGVVHGVKCRYPMEMASSARAYLVRFQEAKSQFAAPRPPEAAVNWEPPSCPNIKVNVDAAVPRNRQCARLGIVARDFSGNIVAWRHRRIDYVTCPEAAETLEMTYGVDLAIEKGWRNVIFEADCLSVVRAINSRIPCLSLAGNFIEAIKAKVNLFDYVSFQHVMRSGNVLAHSLAQDIVMDEDGSQTLPF